MASPRSSGSNTASSVLGSTRRAARANSSWSTLPRLRASASSGYCRYIMSSLAGELSRSLGLVKKLLDPDASLGATGHLELRAIPDTATEQGAPHRREHGDAPLADGKLVRIHERHGMQASRE